MGRQIVLFVLLQVSTIFFLIGEMLQVKADTMVTGMVFCDQCKDGDRSFLDYPLYGAKVIIECGGGNGSEDDTTNWFGNYAVRFDGGVDLTGCTARVVDAPDQCGFGFGPAQQLTLMFRMFGNALYTAEPLMAQPRVPMRFCPRDERPSQAPPVLSPPSSPIVLPPPLLSPPPVLSPPSSPSVLPPPLSPPPVLSPPSSPSVLPPPLSPPPVLSPPSSPSVLPPPLLSSPPVLTPPSSPSVLPPPVLLTPPVLTPPSSPSVLPPPVLLPPPQVSPAPITPSPVLLPSSPPSTRQPPVFPILQASACPYDKWLMPQFQCYWRVVTPNTSAALVFGPIAAERYGTDMTLWDGLQGRGDAYRTLLREATTSLLNSYNSLRFFYTSLSVIVDTNTALMGSTRQALRTAQRFRMANSGQLGSRRLDCNFNPCN